MDDVESANHFLYSNFDDLVCGVDDLMIEDNSNILRVAWRPQLTEIDIIDYIQVVIFDDIFLKFNLGFLGSH